jgi:Trk K+ transport system NAD-binding subunit
LRHRTGVTVAGVWERGHFVIARAATTMTSSSMLVLAGSRDQLDAYDKAFGTDHHVPAPVIIIGGGRVGRAAGGTLAEGGIPYRIVEQQPERIRDPATYVLGDAADLAVLQEAGIQQSPSVIVTTHDDDMNVYLTIYCRRLRPTIQLISRARLDRNVSTLHRAGADAVLSYASVGATAIWNVLTADNTLQLAQGLDVFRVLVPAQIAGRTLEGSKLRDDTGCTVVAIVNGNRFQANPGPDAVLPPDAELILVGEDESEHRFLRRYSIG